MSKWRKRHGKGNGKTPGGAEELANTIASEIDVETGADPTGVLAIRMDRDLNEQVWVGTRATDRVNRLTGSYFANIVNEIEKSMMQQEGWDSFRGRMRRSLGVNPKGEPQGPLRDMIRSVDAEVRLAWNEGTLAVTADLGMVEVWEATLDERTTRACWMNHGKLRDQTGDSIPQHHGCRCRWLSINNPKSPNKAQAKDGRETLRAMRAERDRDRPVFHESKSPISPSTGWNRALWG